MSEVANSELDDDGLSAVESTEASFAQYARTGDEADLNLFMGSAMKLAHIYCARRLQNHQDPEDIAQESLLALANLARAGKIAVGAAVPTLYRISGCDVIDRRRYAGRQPVISDLVPLERAIIPQSIGRVDGPEIRTVGRAAAAAQLGSLSFDRLTESEIRLVIARAEGLSFEQIAAQEGTTAGALRVKMHRARHKLKGTEPPKVPRKAAPRKPPSPPTFTDEELPKVHSLLNQLTSRKQVIVRRSLDGAPPRQIAQELGVTIGMVHYHKLSGVRHIRSLLHATEPEKLDGRHLAGFYGQLLALQAQLAAELSARRLPTLGQLAVGEAVESNVLRLTAKQTAVVEATAGGLQGKELAEYSGTSVSSAGMILRSVKAKIDNPPEPRAPRERPPVLKPEIAAQMEAFLPQLAPHCRRFGGYLLQGMYPEEIKSVTGLPMRSIIVMKSRVIKQITRLAAQQPGQPDTYSTI